LIDAGFRFAGFSEDLPGRGSLVCTSGLYARKHAPWTNFTNMGPKNNRPFSAFPTKFRGLPTVSWVIPNLANDMHNGSVQQGDTWLKDHLSRYVGWARKHNSLLILTWDEDDSTTDNHIATIFVGQMVKPGQYSETINHYNVLRTIEDMYGLPPLGNSQDAAPIADVWQ
jgi:acid phosphatase